MRESARIFLESLSRVAVVQFAALFVGRLDALRSHLAIGEALKALSGIVVVVVAKSPVLKLRVKATAVVLVAMTVMALCSRLLRIEPCLILLLAPIFVILTPLVVGVRSAILPVALGLLLLHSIFKNLVVHVIRFGLVGAVVSVLLALRA